MTETVLEVQGLRKSYNGFRAVDDLSFEVFGGEVFGLLGPNGAGKTTTIRAIMDIFKADQGVIRVLGQAPGAARQLVGYLPEERGLYRDQRVGEVLSYLAELKGVSRQVGRQQAQRWLERVELSAWANRRVRDLSKGMQQKVQFAASLIHDPQLAILDEPFAGLDPVNVDLIKNQIRAIQQEGRTVVLSAHQMNLVEALCDRIVLIHHGKAVLYGSLHEIKQHYAEKSVRLRTPAALTELPGVTQIIARDGVYQISLGTATPQALLRHLLDQDVQVESFEVSTMPLEDIFIAAVKEGHAGLENEEESHA